jgi:hypothetical protein
MITREQFHELAQFEDQGLALSVSTFSPQRLAIKPTRKKRSSPKTWRGKPCASWKANGNGGTTNGRDKNGDKNNDKQKKTSQPAPISTASCAWRRNCAGNGAHAKAVFACAARKASGANTICLRNSAARSSVNRHFHLKPLAQLLGAFPSLGIVLLDRHRARMFDLRLGELNERDGFLSSPHPPRPWRRLRRLRWRPRRAPRRR